MRLLVTGGAGYIGSHTCLELIAAGHDVRVLDNLANSSPVAVDRVRELSGAALPFYRVDLLDRGGLQAVFEDAPVDAVVHFAGLKAVGESVTEPLRYYRNNVAGAINLLEAMQRAGVRRLVFSSSATVYGMPPQVPIGEETDTRPTNPYGRTKLMIEQMLRDLQHAEPGWRVVLLRYFNPVGAHPSGLIGEDPRGAPANLLPFITQVAAGRRPCLKVFGNDYDTPDGTGVRDYLHVMDLAAGHTAALKRLDGPPGLWVYNLGTGRGVSVMEMIRTFETATGQPVPFRVVARRPGDVAVCYAEPAAARRELGWSATRSMHAVCRDAWRWQSRNPQGYEASAE